jgi:hypothetical protein
MVKVLLPGLGEGNVVSGEMQNFIQVVPTVLPITPPYVGNANYSEIVDKVADRGEVDVRQSLGR